MRQYMKVDEKECKNNPLDVLEDVISDLRELELVTMAIADQGDQHTLIDPTQVWHIAHHLGLMHEALAKASEAICKGRRIEPSLRQGYVMKKALGVTADELADAVEAANEAEAEQ